MGTHGRRGGADGHAQADEGMGRARTGGGAERMGTHGRMKGWAGHAQVAGWGRDGHTRVAGWMSRARTGG